MERPAVITPAVPAALRRGFVRDEQASVAEAARLIDHMSSCVGWADLAGRSVLDIGCGVKFTQAFLTHDRPVGAYVGVDVYAEMIEFLDGAVTDPRFSYRVLDAHNDMYNPAGQPLRADTDLGIDEDHFDLVCGLSLFTHLAPDDFATMLALMRRHVADDGWLYFSAFLNESTEAGLGLMDRFFANADLDLEAAAAEGQRAPDFIDLDPTQPLLHAVYARPFATELVEANGWRIEAVHDPVDIVQHQFVCRPA